MPSPESSKKSLTISPPLGRGGERYKDSSEKKKETAGVEKEMNSSVGDVEEREARPPALKERKKRIKREDKLITLDDGTVVSIKEESKLLCGVLEDALDAKDISPLVRGSSASVGGFSWLLDKGVTPTAIKEAISALYAPENSDQLPPLVRSGESRKKKWESGVIPFLERVLRQITETSGVRVRPNAQSDGLLITWAKTTSKGSVATEVALSEKAALQTMLALAEFVGEETPVSA